MAVSVLERPIGVSLGACVSATIDEDYTGYATVNKLSHGLSDGDYVYVSSNVEDYNGFWPIDYIDIDHFFLLQYPNGPRVAYIVDADITYCPSESTHGWSAVHLPIVYKLSNTLYPTNSADTARTVSSFSDAGGYVNLNLSGALKGTVETLDKVVISGASDDDLNGVFQITDAVSTSDITINLAYDAGYSFAGATVQFYYNNYHLRVRIYGGINSTHPWTAIKPYELLNEVKIIPDDDNLVRVSINEILKAHITTRNNLTLATLPNNLDFWTGFYISFAESYDSSDGDEVTTFTSSYTSDNDVIWTPVTVDALDLWTEAFGLDQAWTISLTPTVSLTDTEDSKILYTTEALTAGLSYRITYNYTHTYFGTSLARRIVLQLRDSSGVLITSFSTSVSSGTRSVTETFIAPANVGRIAFYAYQTVGGFALFGDYTINSITVEVNNTASFEGYAINAKLPFKNQYSGFMSEYINGKWLTMFDSPVISNNYFDLSAIINESGDVDVLIDGVVSDTITGMGQGVYRIPITYTGVDQVVKLQVSGVDITDEITVAADTDCSNQSIYLTWLNYLGGFDYWDFTAQKEYGVIIEETTSSRSNIFPTWPNSYGEFADTIDKELYRSSREQIVVRSQHITLEQLNAIKYIRTSPLVQIVVSRTDRRTVLVDTDSFRVYDEGDKLFSITFTIKYTDQIPAQSL
jgi:hypothetical protein